MRNPACSLLATTVLVALVAAASPAGAASEETWISYTGSPVVAFAQTLDANDFTYRRATSCSTLAAAGSASAYDTVVVVNNTESPANVRLTTGPPAAGPCDANRDTVLTVYATSFDPANALTNCLDVNDDISFATRCSTVLMPIPAGQTRVVVITATTNAATPTGLFTFVIDFLGTTPVELLDFSAD